MDPRLLRYYNQELQHLREMGAEFAHQFPKIAGRLGMEGLEVSDPYVERLMEGVGFLAARIQLKLDAEFPRFTQHLLEVLYPHFLAPTPAMLVAQLQPETGEAGLANGVTIPRQTTLRSSAGRNDGTACEFRTAADTRLWPVELVEARYFSFAPDMPPSAVPPGQKLKGGVRLKLRATAGLNFDQMRLDTLRIFLNGADEVAWKLHELIGSASLGALVTPSQRPLPWHVHLPTQQIRMAGFSDEEALLPARRRSFSGYRLLQEYFAFPQRFLFYDIEGLSPALQRAKGNEIEIALLFSRGDAVLENVVDSSNFLLHCTPAINLFPKRLDRINVTDSNNEFHVIADRTRPMDFEVHELTEVVGFGAGKQNDRRFLPLYADHFEPAGDGANAYYTVRRDPRLASERQKRAGTRTSYVGTEMFLQLVDPQEAPYPVDLRQLSLQALCTNRDLPILMSTGGKSDFDLELSAPVSAVRCVKGPSRPWSALADGSVAWRFINHLSLNYLSLLDTDPEQGAAALRELLELYCGAGDIGMKKQVEGLKSVRTQAVVRRLPMPGPLCFGRGIEIGLDVDELAFEGGSAFLFGAVLEQFFGRYVSINSFTETRLASLSRGEIMRWSPRCGQRAVL